MQTDPSVPCPFHALSVQASLGADHPQGTLPPWLCAHETGAQPSSTPYLPGHGRAGRAQVLQRGEAGGANSPLSLSTAALSFSPGQQYFCYVNSLKMLWVQCDPPGGSAPCWTELWSQVSVRGPLGLSISFFGLGSLFSYNFLGGRLWSLNFFVLCEFTFIKFLSE